MGVRGARKNRASCSEEGAVISLPLCGVPPRVTFVLAVDAPFWGHVHFYAIITE